MSSEFVDELLCYQSALGDRRHPALMAYWSLRGIHFFLDQYFSQQEITTLETGCGGSTVLFARYASKHRAYCLDDRSAANSSVAFVDGFPGLQHDKIEFVFGPTDKTLQERPPLEPVDMILIDASHAFPAPQLEYAALIPWLKPNGILALNDIRVPTVNQLYQFLCEDQMLYCQMPSETTAFFTRSPHPLFDLASDAWWNQRFNAQSYPCQRRGLTTARLKIPFELSFEQRIASVEPYLVGGFALVQGKPVTEGSLSFMEIPLLSRASEPLVLELDVEPADPAWQPDRNLELFINYAPVLPIRTEFSGARCRLAYPCELAGSDVLRLKLHNLQLRYAEEFATLESCLYAKQKLGVYVRAVRVMPSQREARGHSPNRISRHDGSVVSFTAGSARLSFFVDYPDDTLQTFHVSGQIYEEEEFALIGRHLKQAARILDVGANVGNHTVYFAKVLGASRIVPVEPQQHAIDLLKINCALNGITCVDFSYLGIALGSRRGHGMMRVDDSRNSGGAVLEEAEQGTVAIEVGDDLFNGQDFDFIKIDVEGNEIDVIEGLRSLIARSRPVFFVEVWDKTRAAFEALMTSLGYEIAGEYKRYDPMVNLLLTPR